MSNKPDTNETRTTCGLAVALCSAPTYAEILKALDDLHIVCECAMKPEVDEWYRCDAFAKEARQRAIDVLNRHAQAMRVHKYGPGTMPTPNIGNEPRR